MRILITGATGFLSGRMAQFLSAAGHEVVLGSRSLTHAPNWLAQAKVVKTRWDSPEHLNEICKSMDVVIHSAGMNAQDCTDDPAAALLANGVATAYLLQASARAQVKQFIYFSTAHVYKSNLQGVITEDTPTQNLHPYATSHLAGEACVRYATQQGHIKGTVIRLSNAFGYPLDATTKCWGLLVNDLCKQVVQTGAITLRTTGLQQRDFIAITDVCNIIYGIIGSLPGQHPDFVAPEVLNVGSGQSMTVLDCAQLIAKRAEMILGKTIEIKRPTVQTSLKNESSEDLFYSIARLKQLGIQPGDSSIKEIDDLLLYCKREFIAR